MLKPTQIAFLDYSSVETTSRLPLINILNLNSILSYDSKIHLSMCIQPHML